MDTLEIKHEALKQLYGKRIGEIKAFESKIVGLVERIRLAEKCMASSYSAPSVTPLEKYKDNCLRIYRNAYPTAIIEQLEIERKTNEEIVRSVLNGDTEII